MYFALKDDNLVHISEVERGLDCGCICPACKSKLIARKGKKKIHHFAHSNNEDCNKGIETSLHMMAKAILEKAKCMKLPNALILTKPIMNNKKFGIEIYLPIDELNEFNNVQLEKKVNNFIPDVILYRSRTPLIVEIKVTHAVDNIKYEKIANSNISAIEIDLSDFLKADVEVTEEILHKRIIEQISKKKWIYNKKAYEYEKLWINACTMLCVSKDLKYAFIGQTIIIEKCALNKEIYVRNDHPFLPCLKCEYCIRLEDKNHRLISFENIEGYLLKGIEFIYCSAKHRISTFEDLKKYKHYL